MRPAGVLTAAGELVLRRRYYWGQQAGGCYPSDEHAGIAASAVTAGARELCCVMGLADGFRSAAANLRRVGGLAVCPERLRQVVEAEASRATALRDAGAVPAAFSAKAQALEKGRLYVGVDGLMVRTVTQAEKDKRRKAQAARRRARGRRGITTHLKPLPPARPGTDQAFKELKFALFYDQPKEHRHALATAGDAAELGRLLRLHAGQVGLAAARQRLALTDGAPWIARQLERNLPMLDARLLDFYHLAQHVHAAADACLGDGTAASAAWAQARLHAAKHAGATALLVGIDALARSVHRSPAKREATRLLRGYVTERLDMLDYPSARRRGWDIGSGPTEAAAKTLAGRLKGVGMKWDLDHAADLMNLKALYESGQAPDYWATAAKPCLN